MAASFYTSCFPANSAGYLAHHPNLSQVVASTLPNLSHKSRSRSKNEKPRRLSVFAATKGSAKSTEPEEKIPSWAKPDSDELPPWARDEAAKKDDLKQGTKIPFYGYLIASAITAIAAGFLWYKSVQAANKEADEQDKRDGYL